jgi:TonB-linked SusC/RagA family outer membrane protein
MHKVGFIVLVVSAFIASIGEVHAQDVLDTKMVRIAATRHASLAWVFREIQYQSRLLFVYQPNSTDLFTDILVQEGLYTVRQLLDTVFLGTPFGYNESGRNIIVFKRSIPFKVQGRVVDSEIGEPLPSVSIVSEDKRRGTTTDEDGNFSIEVEKNEILVFSYVGRISKRITIHSNAGLNVSLNAVTLDAVTINTGYYAVPHTQAVGNVFSMSDTQIKRSPASNLLQSLQGRVPGAFIEQLSGIPGGGYTIRIRGRNSLREEGNNPLYIIDGVPYPSVTLSSPDVGGDILPRSNPLNAIDPASIERIEILKDADATAIYGSRGANGVVLVTTKRANRPVPGAEVRMYSGFGQVAHHMDLLNSQQWVTMRKEAFRNDNVTLSAANAYDLVRWDTTRYTDWQEKLIGGTAQITNANVSVYGGKGQTHFLLTGDYRKETTVFPGAFDYVRAGTLLNLEHESENNRFHLSLTPNFSHEKTFLPVADLTSQAVSLPPVAPSLYTTYGELNWADNTWTNPLAYTIQTYESKTSNFILNNIASYRVLTGLHIRANIGYNMMVRDEMRLEPIRSHSPTQIAQGITGTNISATNKLTTFITEPQIDYARTLGRGKINILVGATYQRSLQQGKTIGASGIINDGLIRDQGSAPHLEQYESLYQHYKYAAFFSRINYTWGSRYILNVTGRRDGSSRFGSSNGFATFGAVGAGWIFTNEAFADPWDGVSFGKLRFSYGTTGSDQIGDYGYLDSYKATPLGYNGGGIKAVRPENPAYSWELSRKMEVGLALGFVKNRIQLDLSYYRNRSSNQLVGRRLPELTGFSTVQYNTPATVQNSGLEVLLSTTQIDSKDWTWTSSANFTLLDNKLVRYDNLAASGDNTRYRIGNPVDIKMLYHYTGIDPKTGNFTFQDKNNDGLDFTDRYAVSYGPRFYGGIDNVIRYRHFELSFLFQFVKQTRQDLIAFFPVPPGGQTQNQPVNVMQRWQKEGDVAPIHRFTQGAGVPEYRQGILNGDMIYADASYIRLKSAALYYTVFYRTVETFGEEEEKRQKSIKLFVMGQNLLTFTGGFKGLDPESLDPRVLPPLRIVNAGVEINL